MRWKAEDPFSGLPDYLGDMRAPNGGYLWWEIEAMATRLTPLVFQQVAETPAYQLLTKVLPPEKIPIYFNNRVGWMPVDDKLPRLREDQMP